MRIGILTLPLHTNYGGILQAYALQTTLERMGHNVDVFQTYYNGIRIPLSRYPFVLGKRFFRKCFINRKTVVFRELKKRKEAPLLRTHIDGFINKQIHAFEIGQLREIPLADYDAIIVGSDQIWRPSYVRRMWKTDVQDAFLRFTSGWNGKRVSYAASFGVDRWLFSEEETAECKLLAQLFDAVSVREDSGVDMCRNHLGINATQLIDPTLLLTKDDYTSLIREEKGSHRYNNGIFNYVLDETPDKQQLIYRIAKDRNLKPYGIVINSQDLSKPVEERVLPPIEEWIKCFRDAKFVVTDSFHGCVFSIIFRKPFVAMANTNRGVSRFRSLLSLLELEDHLLTNTEQYSSSFSYDIPDSISIRIEALVKESTRFLNQVLS